MREKRRKERIQKEDPERYAMMKKDSEAQKIRRQERERQQAKIKFDEPQPCPHCGKMFEFKYGMQVSAKKVKGRIKFGIRQQFSRLMK